MSYLIAFICIYSHLSFELFACYYLLDSDTPMLKAMSFLNTETLLLGHLVISIFTAVLSYPYYKKRFLLPWHRLSFIIVFIPLFLFPLFGSLLLALSLLFLIFIRKDNDVEFSDETDDKEFFELFEFKNPHQTSEELQEMLIKALEIEPYLDILKGSDEELKKGALNKLSERVTPESVKLLRISLQDESSEIRLMSSKALSKIEETINDDIQSASQRVKEEPKNIEAKNTFGKICFRYATLGVHDKITQKYYLNKAVNEFIISLQQDPHQDTIMLLLGKILLMIHNFDKAKDIFKKIVETNPGLIEPRLFLCDAYLGLKDFEAIGKECLYIRDNLKVESKHTELINYWVSYERKNRTITT